MIAGQVVSQRNGAVTWVCHPKVGWNAGTGLLRLRLAVTVVVVVVVVALEVKVKVKLVTLAFLTFLTFPVVLEFCWGQVRHRLRVLIF